MSGRIVTVFERRDGHSNLVVRSPGVNPAVPLPKIFAWVNSGRGSDWQVGMALAEDGTCLASHVSSSRDWFRFDMGLISDRKHDLYEAHYPQGYELEEVPEGEEQGHAGLSAAYALNQQLAEADADDSEAVR